MSQELSIFRVVHELIEQPSWGGDFITKLKGLDQTHEWSGKKVGQAYELAIGSRVVDLATGIEYALNQVVQDAPEQILGAQVVEKHGGTLNLLIKLTQAKGNSFQVHLPEGEHLNHWLPKPEAWFYLGPGLYTFGLRDGISYADFSAALKSIDAKMHALSEEVISGKLDVEEARKQAAAHIEELDPYQYINTVHAKTDDIVDLTAGGIHHSWEEDNEAYPEGNLVYEVQVDVQDEFCSMRGFDKGKILDNGKIRPTHVDDYLATVSQDPERSDLSRYIQKPELLSENGGKKREALFRTRYFNLDRLIASAGSTEVISTAGGLQHLFVLAGEGTLDTYPIKAGESYVVTAQGGSVDLAANSGLTILQTWLPV